MVLTDEQKSDIYPAATLETSKIATEENYYDISSGQVVNKSAAIGIPDYQNNNVIPNPPSNPSFDNANSARLYVLNKNSQKTGLGITLKVMAGDKLDIYGKSYYFQNNTGGTSVNSAIPVLDILTGFLGSPTGGITATHGAVTASELNSISTTTSPITSMLTDQTNTNNLTPQKPKAFINYILFDDQFKCVGSGFAPVGDNAVLTDYASVAALHNIAVNKNGYVYIYCSNESPVDVFFDNLQVVHTMGRILEETHYYPFGLTMAGISDKAAGGLENKYKFNKGSELQNKEFSDGSGLELYATNLRSLDPQLGRWWQIDPKPDMGFSLYSAMNNNPILYNDPLGDTLDFPGASSEFIYQFYDAYANLDSHGVGDDIAYLIASPVHIAVFKETQTLQSSQYIESAQTLIWNPVAALKTAKGVTLTPAAILDHEAEHAVYALKHPNQKRIFDKQYGTTEERRVIEGREQKTALALGLMKKGQVTRTEHDKGYLFLTSGPTTTNSVVEDKVTEELLRMRNDNSKDKHPKMIDDSKICFGCVGPYKPGK